MLRKIFLPLFVLTALGSYAQELRPIGAFHVDSAFLAQVVPYSLSFEYPRNFKVVFPDSTYDFSPFEYDRKQVFTTQSDSAISRDSIIYFLSSFEIDPVLTLGLPIYLVNNSDSSIIHAERDTIFFKQVVASIPDSIALKENVAYNEVGRQFNYPYFIIGLSSSLILAILAFIFFGKPVRNRIKIYRMKKAHEKFILGFDKWLDKLKSLKNRESCESSLLFWKRYMENIQKQPYSKMTTKEIDRLVQNSGIKDALTKVDRAIYGGMSDDSIIESLGELKKYAIEAFNEELKKVGNEQ